MNVVVCSLSGGGGGGSEPIVDELGPTSAGRARSLGSSESSVFQCGEAFGREFEWWSASGGILRER